MKLAILVCLVLSALTAWSKKPAASELSKELVKTFQDDITRDDGPVKVKQGTVRAPASVDPDTEKVGPLPKYEKMNQIGPNKW